VWVSDLVSEVGARVASAHGYFWIVLYRRTCRLRLTRFGTLKTATVLWVMIAVGVWAMNAYRNARRYPAGVMPVPRRNARVKLDCEENWQSRAISWSDARPVAIIAFAFSSRRRLT
jgi:hypothetical protein